MVTLNSRNCHGIAAIMTAGIIALPPAPQKPVKTSAASKSSRLP